MTDVKATRDALSAQKRTSGTSKHKIPPLFTIFVDHFALLDPDPHVVTDPNPVNQSQCGSMRVHNTSGKV
jgi:hypothetical protein